MAATTVFQHQFADIGLAAAVEDRLAGGEDRVLLLHAPHHMDGNVGVGEQGIDQETVGCPDVFLIAQINDGEVVVYEGAIEDLFPCLVVLFEIKLDAFDHIRQFQDLVDGVIAAILDEIHHQAVVADPEFPEAPEAGASIHQEIE